MRHLNDPHSSKIAALKTKKNSAFDGQNIQSACLLHVPPEQEHNPFLVISFAVAPAIGENVIKYWLVEMPMTPHGNLHVLYLPNGE